MKTIRVAAIQVTSLNGRMARNLANAERYVAQAAAAGAELVLCPEFLAAGYIYEESIWQAGEPAGGMTEQWLQRMAATHGVIIGATFLEAEGEDFYNTFSLFDAAGKLLGRVRKQSLPVCEGWFFAPCSGSKVIETPLGKMCVGICNDNQTATFLRKVIDRQPDLILMPHSAPTPLFGRSFDRFYGDVMGQVSARYATSLGIPVVMANKVAHEPTSTRIPLLPLVRLRWVFRGHSAICDSDGTILEQLVDQEGAIVQPVTLDGARKKEVRPPQGYWSFPPALMPTTMGGALRVLSALGQWGYARSERRVQAARAASR